MRFSADFLLPMLEQARATLKLLRTPAAEVEIYGHGVTFHLQDPDSGPPYPPLTVRWKKDGNLWTFEGSFAYGKYLQVGPSGHLIFVSGTYARCTNMCPMMAVDGVLTDLVSQIGQARRFSPET